jgi:hypothetical protein
MQVKDRTLRAACRLAVVLILNALPLIVSTTPDLYAAGYSGSRVVSLDAKGEPLGEVLQTIADVTGYRITVNSEWAGWPVNAVFNNLPVNLGLRRILSNLNHSMVFHEVDQRIAILIQSSPDDVKAPVGAVDRPADAPRPAELHPGTGHSKDSTRLGDGQVVPREDSGVAGKTQKPAQQAQGQRARLAPDDMEVIPPGEHGREAVTLRDIKAQKRLRPAMVLKNSELVPPEE